MQRREMTRPISHFHRRPRGAILIVAMIVVFTLAAMVLVLGQSMRVEASASANQLAAGEAAAVARGAEQYVLALLAQTTDPLELKEERLYQAIPVGTGYFWIVRPDYGDPTLPAYGLVDESAKIDLNRIPQTQLVNLPGMTETTAGAICDWRDEDGEVSNSGAESQTYLSRPDPYNAKNALFETVEELSLIEGMTPELLYGMGTTMPLGEQTSSKTGTPLGSEQYQLRGLHDYFTVWGETFRAPPDGPPYSVRRGRRAIRAEVRRTLVEKLGQDRGQQLADAHERESNPITAYQDLFDWALQLKLQASELELVESSLTGDRTNSDNEPIRYRINVNNAPREVLLCIEGLDVAAVDDLLARRPNAVARNPQSIAWVFDVLQERSKGLERFVTSQGLYRSADIVAVSGNGRGFKRVRIVIDVSTAGSPRIVYRRDQTDLGFPLDPAILESLRAGMRLNAGQSI